MKMHLRYQWLPVCVLLVGCASGSVAPLTEHKHGFGQFKDEQKLIHRSEQLESELRTRGLVLEDEAVNSYVQRVGQSLVPAQVTGPLKFRFHVLRDPFVNAFALPNGAIYLNVGLLVRLTNEAQLAHILGHEISHVVQRHGLKGLRNRKATMISAHILDLTLLGTSLAYLPALGVLAGHSQRAETESDRLALDLMLSADYSLRGTEELFKLLQEVNQRESFLGSVYSSHPDNADRAEKTRNWLTEGKFNLSQGKINEAEYRMVRERVALENLRLKLNLNQYALTLKAVERDLALSPSSPWFYYYRGEAYRLMAENPEGTAREEAWINDKRFSKDRVEQLKKQQGEHRTKANEAFRLSLEKDPSFYHAHRGMGLLALAEGKNETARQELNLYLKQGREISDRGYINIILGRIKQ